MLKCHHSILCEHCARVVRDMDVWKDLSSKLRVQESRISGTLMDAGDIPVDPLPEGVKALLEDRNRWRERAQCAASEERTKIAVWLRSLVNEESPGGPTGVFRAIAESIERGEHEK